MGRIIWNFRLSHTCWMLIQGKILSNDASQLELLRCGRQRSKLSELSADDTEGYFRAAAAARKAGATLVLGDRSFSDALMNDVLSDRLRSGCISVTDRCHLACEAGT